MKPAHQSSRVVVEARDPKWFDHRREIELGRTRSHIEGGRKRRTFRYFLIAIPILRWLLTLTGLRRLSFFKATKVRVRNVDVWSENLPKAFEGYTILQITDLHLDVTPGIERILSRIVRALPVDLVVMTGDFQDRASDSGQQILPQLKVLVDSLKSRDGVFATLGNHDTARMVEHFKTLGIETLCNQKVKISRDEDSIHLVGIDDVHYFHTQAANAALKSAPPGYKICAVHSPEACLVAQACGFDFYFCGHTHGGQICLPNGKPIMSHSTVGRRFAQGAWKLGSMQGYTSFGAGVIGLTARLFCQSEVVIFRLRKSA